MVSTLFYDGSSGGQSLDLFALRNQMPGLRRPGKLRRIPLIFPSNVWSENLELAKIPLKVLL